MADLFDALGSPDKAAEIRESGCIWWWKIPMQNKATGQVKDEEMCGAEALPRYFNDYGAEIKIASGTIQADRNEQKAALEEVDRAASELGASEVIAKLAQLGARAYLGDKITSAREQLAIESNGGEE